MEIKFLLIFLILIITICIIFTCLNMREYYVEKNDIINMEKFSSNSNENKLIFYWAKWCGVCQRIKPIWKQSKEAIAQRYPNLKIEEIECDDPDKCFVYKNNTKEIIEGVPTIILRNGTNDKEYIRDESNNILGNKESSDMIKFLDLYLEK